MLDKRTSTTVNRELEWTSFNKPKRIRNGTTTTATVESAFVYGPDRARIQHLKTEGAVVTTLKYIGNAFEQKAKTASPTEYIHYIRAGATVAIYTSKSDSTEQTRYLHKDHLGSVETLTDEAGAVTESLSYDPHGKRRLTDWQDSTLPIIAVTTPRGFTGHEHLDELGLIHMNGRVYDPELGRFISADPFVQVPDSTQGLNRYTYVNNNPLSFTDPSGFFFSAIFDAVKSVFKAAASVVKKVVSTAKKVLSKPVVRQIAAIAINFIPGGQFGAVLVKGFAAGFIASGGDLKTALVGGISAGAFFGVGEYFQGLAIANGIKDNVAPFLTAGQQVAKGIAHGVVGGVTSKLAGGEFKDGFLGAAAAQFGSGIIDRIPSSPGRVLAAAIVGGTASKLGGGKFANGAVSGAFSRFFNEEFHHMNEEGYEVYDSKEWESVRIDELPIEDWQVTGEIPVGAKVKIPGTKRQFSLSVDIQAIKKRYGQFEIFGEVKVERYRFTWQPTGKRVNTGRYKQKWLGNVTDVEYGIRLCTNNVCGPPALTWDRDK